MSSQMEKFLLGMSEALYIRGVLSLGGNGDGCWCARLIGTAYAQHIARLIVSTCTLSICLSVPSVELYAVLCW